MAAKEPPLTPQLPHDEEAERLVLAGLMREPSLNAAAFGELCRGDFYVWQHGLVYDAALSLWLSFRPVSLADVYAALRELGALPEFGADPAGWLVDVWESDPTGAYCLGSAAAVRLSSLRRQVLARQREVRGRLDGYSPDELAAMV